MKNPIRVAVIGAGWYGCHITSELSLQGIDVVLYESTDVIFSGASGNNQYRLHQGFHYARSKSTRLQSRDGFFRFLDSYPELSSPTVGKNYYMVPQNESLIDFETYVDVMSSSGLQFEKVSGPNDLVKNIEGSIVVGERVIQTRAAIQYFSRNLEKNLRLGVPVTDLKKTLSGYQIQGEHFDWVIDATWGHRRKKRDVYFETSLLLYVEGNGHQDAITLVDGNLWSLYPTDTNGIFTLSQVETTPLERHESSEQAHAKLNSYTKNDIGKQAKRMLEAVSKHFSRIKEMPVVDYQLSIKSKKYNLAENRTAYIEVRDKEISVFSGKIDSIFDVVDEVRSLLV